MAVYFILCKSYHRLLYLYCNNCILYIINELVNAKMGFYERIIKTLKESNGRTARFRFLEIQSVDGQKISEDVSS